MLAVDAAAGGGEDVVRHKLRHGSQLSAVDLRGDQAGWHQTAIPELRSAFASTQAVGPDFPCSGHQAVFRCAQND